MAISRSDLVDYATNRYSGLLTNARISQTDDAAGIGPDIDCALRALGIAESDLSTPTIDDTAARDIYAIVDYCILYRALLGVSVQTDVNGANGVIRSSRSQLYNQFKDDLAMAKSIVITHGFGPKLGLVKTPAVKVF